MIRTKAEVDHLRELIRDTLDTDGDGVVRDDVELMDNYALVADELEAWGIYDAPSLNFWANEYEVGTEVSLQQDGTYAVTKGKQSLRGDCLRAYENGDLAYAALEIENGNPTKRGLAEQRLIKLEAEWREYFTQQSQSYSRENFARIFAAHSLTDGWEYNNIDPAAIAADFSDAEMKTMFSVMTYMDFIQIKGIKYQPDIYNMTDMLGSGPGIQGGTATHNILALHLLKSTGESGIGFTSFPHNTPLSFNTKQGTLFFFATSKIFPLDHYDTTSPQTGDVRREYESVMEPWQALASSYLEVANQSYARGDYQQAKTDYEATLEICPEHLPTRYAYAQCLKAMGDVDGAIENLNELFKIHPSYEPAQDLLIKYKRAKASWFTND